MSFCAGQTVEHNRHDPRCDLTGAVSPKGLGFRHRNSVQQSSTGGAAVLWTGGKDSCLALHRAHDQGLSVTCLATFVPADGQEFRAHPRRFMMRQAQALRLPHSFIPVVQPYRESYVEGLTALKEEMDVDTVITGDIDLVSGFPNWISECCEGLGIEVVRPLWKSPRGLLMKELVDRRIEAQITWINHPKIPPSWKGRILDRGLISELNELALRFSFDLCGENGEYHTMVVGAPLFREQVSDG